jgi:hypothetical protein
VLVLVLGNHGFDRHAPTLGRVSEDVPVDAGCEAGIGVAQWAATSVMGRPS